MRRGRTRGVRRIRRLTSGYRCRPADPAIAYGGCTVSEFLEKRHENPDYELDVQITGVRLPKGVINWNVHINGEHSAEAIADIFDKVSVVLRGGGENRVSTEEPNVAS